MRTQGGDGHLQAEERGLRRPALPTPGPQTSGLLTQKANVYCGSRPSEPLVTAVSANSSTESAEKGFLGTVQRCLSADGCPPKLRLRESPLVWRGEDAGRHPGPRPPSGVTAVTSESFVPARNQDIRLKAQQTQHQKRLQSRMKTPGRLALCRLC